MTGQHAAVFPQFQTVILASWGWIQDEVGEGGSRGSFRQAESSKVHILSPRQEEAGDEFSLI